MADSQLHSSTSTLSVDKDLRDLEKPTLDDPNSSGSDDIEQGSGDDVEKRNEDLENGPERPPPRAVLDWDGPDDAHNPHNWALSKRILHIVTPAVISLTA
jgi:hypothetical protein